MGDQRHDITIPGFAIGPHGEPREDVRVLAVYAAALFGAGCVLGCLSVVVPAESQFDKLPGLLTSLAAGVMAILVYLVRDRIGMRAIYAVWGAGMVDVALFPIFAFEDATYNAVVPTVMYYLWGALYAGYFFRRHAALLGLAFIGVCFSAVLVILAGWDETFQNFVLTFGTIATIGMLVSFLRERMERLVVVLSRAATTDALTGLLNRGAFSDRFEQEIERARRSDATVALLVGDIDHFKEINDRFGHAGGDRALEAVAEMLQRTKRRCDVAARLGGEEFALILPDAEGAEAVIAAERMRREVGERSAEVGLGVTISFGIATFPEHGLASEDVMLAADRALYEAKRLGRNRTVVHEGPLTVA